MAEKKFLFHIELEDKRWFFKRFKSFSFEFSLRGKQEEAEGLLSAIFVIAGGFGVTVVGSYCKEVANE